MPAHPRYPHLPAGRTPGPQTSSNKVGRSLGMVFFAVTSVAGLVASVLLFAGVIENNDPTTTAIILLAVTVLFAGLGLLIWRMGRHARGLEHLTLSADAADYERGDQVKARVQIGDPAKMAADTEAGLVCTTLYEVETTNGKGGRQPTTNTTVAWESWQPVDPAQTIQEFTFELPASGPYSHEGKVISFAWKVSVREPRRGRIDPRADEPIWVYP